MRDSARVIDGDAQRRPVDSFGDQVTVDSRNATYPRRDTPARLRTQG